MSDQVEALYGQLAFDAYSKNRNGVTHDGKPIPNWDGLSEDVRGAWGAAAVAVIRSYQDARRLRGDTIGVRTLIANGGEPNVMLDFGDREVQMPVAAATKYGTDVVAVAAIAESEGAIWRACLSIGTGEDGARSMLARVRKEIHR